MRTPKLPFKLAFDLYPFTNVNVAVPSLLKGTTHTATMAHYRSLVILKLIKVKLYG
jgi:hypothetical protein